MIHSLLPKLAGSRIVLASGSPRRKDILESIGLKVEVIPSTFEENLEPSMFPSLEKFVIETAFQKAQEVAERLHKAGQSPELIIAADTIVAFNGKVYGKPGNDETARTMLNELSGHVHDVLTGVTLIWNGYSSAGDGTDGFIYMFCEKTKVQVTTLSEETISSYIQTKEPLDKAGAYGIQGIGGSLIEKIDGDYYNVVGFPLHRFCKHVVNHYKMTQLVI